MLLLLVLGVISGILSFFVFHLLSFGNILSLYTFPGIVFGVTTQSSNIDFGVNPGSEIDS